MHAVPVEARRGGQMTGTGVTGGCMPFCRCWDLNQSPLEEEPLLLTLELFFSSLHVFIISEKRSPNKARFIVACSYLCPGLKFIREKKLQSLITNVNTNICCYQPPSNLSH